MKKKSEKWLTIAQVIAISGGGRSTISRYCRTRVYPNAKQETDPFGKLYWLIPESDLSVVKKIRMGRPRDKK